MTFARRIAETREQREERLQQPRPASHCAPLARGVYAPVSAKPAPAPKSEPARSEAYRRLVAGLPCMVCSATPCQAAHPNTGKGMAMKADDRECFPLCPRCHTRFDQGGLFPKEARRALEPAWGAQTRAVLMATRAVPPRLVAMLKLQPDGSYAP